MKIFKFGGASVKDANGIRNLAAVLEITGEKKLLVIVSAMGKMTNSLEVVVSNYFSNRAEIDASVSEIYNYHYNIISEVFHNNSHPVFSEVQKLFKDLSYFLKHSKSKNHAFVYDQVVGYGELASTTIV
ncbi:MAG: aspartate kinase, partial [Flavobacteriales bacterium]